MAVKTKVNCLVTTQQICETRATPAATEHGVALAFSPRQSNLALAPTSMVPLLILLLALVLIAFPIWALLKILALESRNERLEQRLRHLEERSLPAPAHAHLSSRADRPPVIPPSTPPNVAPARPRVVVPPTIGSLPETQLPPPSVRTTESEPTTPHSPPPLPAFSSPSAARAPTAPVSKPLPSRFDWEQFTGTKLLAWTGGAAAFLGAAFFVKYSFDHDLISPALRVAIGYVFAFALVLGGLRMPRRRYAVTAQTLCATGIVCLYAVTFACSSIYEFSSFTPFKTFVLMALITTVAFVLAVRLGAQVVAVLGMLGGFLTPVLLSTGRDNAFGLFGYIALLDAGLIALALRQRWFFVVPLGAAGTVAMQLGWAVKFLTPAKAPTAMVVCLVFCVLFLAARLAAQWYRRAAPQLLWPAVALPGVALVFALGFIGYPGIAAQPGLLFGFVFAVDACLLALAWLDDDAHSLHLIGGFSVFVLLAVWTGARLTDELLPWALGLYLLHGVIHTSFPLLLVRRRSHRTTSWLSQVFPPLALVLMLVPFFKLDAVSFGLWPCVLLVDLLAIGLAVFSGSIIAVSAALLLTLVATTLWMFRLPPTLANEMPLLLVIGGFAALFFAAGLLLARRIPDSGAPGGYAVGDRRVQLPAFSALMPFLLLVLMTQRLTMVSPSGVFGLALLLVILTLGLTSSLVRSFDSREAFDSGQERPAMRGDGASGVEWLPACALAGVALLEYSWEARHLTRSFGDPPFAWSLVFYAVFAIFPFVIRSRFAGVTGPWAVAATVGIVQFPLIHRIVDRNASDDIMGIVPALFAVAPLASMFAIHRARTLNGKTRLNQLAWFGGVALFFITLIVPIQFERQWMTLGWALEGTALLWLFRHVPHPGLRATAVVLLVAAFVRLALNPAVLEYHARSSIPILNWFLYSYGVVTACLFVGATLLPVNQDRAFGIRVRPLLNSLGVVLAFLLLNIEIADFFSAPGTRVLTFQFSGHFGRDMTYTIAWALFALTLLLMSIWQRTPAGRYSALALLGAAVLKLFLHDLARLGALHRIGALFAVAIIAIVASLAYQRFLPADNSSDPKS